MSEVVSFGLPFLLEQEDRRRAFDLMVAQALRETEDKGTRQMDDILARVDAVIETAERCPRRSCSPPPNGTS